MAGSITIEELEVSHCTNCIGLEDGLDQSLVCVCFTIATDHGFDNTMHKRQVLRNLESEY